MVLVWLEEEKEAAQRRGCGGTGEEEELDGLLDEWVLGERGGERVRGVARRRDRGTGRRGRDSAGARGEGGRGWRWRRRKWLGVRRVFIVPSSSLLLP